ncbi:hypothetical protein M1307_00890, partial [Patescibacteria group bacterium]|nr:hypothetical protein [Patescibacteria group bacterium]
MKVISIKQISESVRLFKKRLNIFFLEKLYQFHIHIRYLHDKVYEKSSLYKSYSDKSFTNTLHKVGFAGFLVSFVTFYL